MRFALSEEATALRDAAREVLANELSWDKLAAVGVVGTLVPEERGGLGLDENALVPLLDEIGYSGLPAPAVETIAVAAPLLAEARLAKVPLAKVPLAKVPLAKALPDTVPDGWVAVQARPGELIAFGGEAGLVVMRKGPDLWVYGQEELRVEPCASVDGSRRLARVAAVSGGVLLTGDPDVVEVAWRRGVLGTAALLTGLARRMLDMTVAYVKRREQYGVPVGSFQAVKHALADALVAIEFARPVVLAAGWAQAAGAPDAGVLTSAAKVRAADAARKTARTAIQCHGAMGYTTEYDLHLFAKRAWALAPAWGDTSWHRARIAREIGVNDG
jgi:alkylation response protein AidB-like acyl-CoA dehydrogenase